MIYRAPKVAGSPVSEHQTGAPPVGVDSGAYRAPTRVTAAVPR